ncbi:PREDICTED: uncharacterized protein LOC105452372 [Wasmannia auropunctata]|uniref:uncharacterized protein LOC105452372 n=1 Tax=Wasmannia auropunctata TaxID=64793 RepID=UPI0005EF6668|nr:PREDICTED: uncharacterized protein LOC105452372 [Wasmannia auropunctata]
MSAKTSKDLCALRDQTVAAVQALKNLERPVEHWDDILVFLVSQKLDSKSREALELKLGDTVDSPTFRDLTQFMDCRIRALEALGPVHSKERTSENAKSAKHHILASHSAATINFVCPVCNHNHLLYQCSTFLSQTPSQRGELIRKFKRCINCFSAKHMVKECTSSRACKKCNKKHHTLLHLDMSVKSSSAESSGMTGHASENSDQAIATHVVSQTISPNSKILLATARVRVHSPHGHTAMVRALIDQGSVATLMTESIAQYLRLPKIKQAVYVTGIGDTKSAVRYAAPITITSASGGGPAYTTNALVLRSLTKYTPNRLPSSGLWKHISGLTLADNEPMSLDPIELIIGADLYGGLLLDGVRKGSANEPVAQNTTFGWILSGPVTPSATYSSESVHIHHGTVFEILDQDLRRFWEIENVPQNSPFSPAEIQCEEHFVATHSRTTQGRYIVRLPFKNGPPVSLGESRQIASSFLYKLENRLCRQPKLASEYNEFLSEYYRLGHMAKIRDSSGASDAT